jgi:hypothetical protein
VLFRSMVTKTKEQLDLALSKGLLLPEQLSGIVELPSNAGFLKWQLNDYYSGIDSGNTGLRVALIDSDIIELFNTLFRNLPDALKATISDTQELTLETALINKDFFNWLIVSECGSFYISLSIQVRIFSRRYSSSRKP